MSLPVWRSRGQRSAHNTQRHNIRRRIKCPSHNFGEGWFLIVVQAHYRTDAELVEGGQLFAIHIGERKEK